MKILMVLTSHDQMGDTGHKTGFWLEEFTAPFYVFKDAGADITLASPKGGQPPVDPNSEAEDALTESTRRFSEDTHAREMLASTRKLADVDMNQYDAIFYPGGHGPLWDLAEDDKSIALIKTAYEQDKVIGAVCHAPAVFKNVFIKPDQNIVGGREVTGFSNTEEDAVQLTNIVPFLLEDMLKQNNARYSRGDDWAPHIVVDGKLITGQNPASSEGAAKAVLQALQQD
ncbi:MAG TPA: type 1 glutamine amidotransferase domain-containing protein [Marinobacter hydrocarbonoclasticus]|jgi:putative intracellular protease/amidase|uniref:Putative intracellular protease/amidase n=1 Tax=Marinobacter nauticus TaxID=2743 RepID=A0A350RTQ2_MARNT|nr:MULTISPECIES: type 1 glutamine amidotransferase domain-containing protein [Marinobacter]ERS88111.1 dimethylallyltransferase [Marinobacter sp. EVN1]MAC21174.1 type 1 glutamine amidotransferase domain-containing protein [Marinobacter sp.]MBH92123.1 type 1 glutamine amidotransferase domain-containing protein [Marinobacter sp.]MBN8240919.1 type 1 glutamine amidotransferase domain-containing protein [Marinobacter nauticus]MBY6101978.1 type 1 glutamine amidotransferase domain-containing protein [|tara:strand:- start:488 stop:1171 length:684 start_codon:yes stop_codon:yes gene_type:complete